MPERHHDYIAVRDFFERSTEDPHDIDLKPCFAKELNRADRYLQVGQGIENAWLGKLVRSVANAAVKAGGKANLNLSLCARTF